jgi:hypothetical protein
MRRPKPQRAQRLAEQLLAGLLLPLAQLPLAQLRVAQLRVMQLPVVQLPVERLPAGGLLTTQPELALEGRRPVHPARPAPESVPAAGMRKAAPGYQPGEPARSNRHAAACRDD